MTWTLTELIDHLRSRMNWLAAEPSSTTARTDVRQTIDAIERMLT